MPKKRLPIIPLVLILGGLVACISATLAGYQGLRKSILAGLATRDWPTTSGEAYSARISTAHLFLWPNHQAVFAPYYYNVNGNRYSNFRYDVHGVFVGSEAQVKEYRQGLGNITVHYNPDDPSEAVLKPGISFDRMTYFYMTLDAVSLLLIFAGLFGIWIHSRRLKVSTAKSTVPPPLPNSATTAPNSQQS
jgi:hypothetical protein